MTPRKTTDKIRRIYKCAQKLRRRKNLHSNSFSALPTTPFEEEKSLLRRK